MKRYRWALVFASGAVAGLVLAKAWLHWLSRQGGAPGGELLVPLMIGLLIYTGYCCRDFVEAARQEGGRECGNSRRMK